jgi:hypothetical protein
MLVIAGLSTLPSSIAFAADKDKNTGHVYTTSGADTAVTGTQDLAPALSLPPGAYVVIATATVRQLGTAISAPLVHGDVRVSLVAGDAAHPAGQVIDSRAVASPGIQEIASGTILKNDVLFHTVITNETAGAFLAFQVQNPSTTSYSDQVSVTWRLTAIVASGVN